MLFILLNTACSSKQDYSGAADSYETGSQDEASDATADSAEQDTAIFVQPVWWRLSAGLFLREGSPVLKDSTLFIELLADDGELLCEQELSLDAVESLEPPSTLIMSWWSLTPSPSAQLCGVFDSPLSETIRIGVGSMHPEILAVIGSLSAIDDPAPLNAAYATIVDDGPLVVYGVAGLPEAYEGLGEVAEEAPIPDGFWQLKPVYQFSYEQN